MVRALVTALAALFVLGGCMAAAPLSLMGTGAAAGAMGTGVYNASQDGPSQSGVPGAAQAPIYVVYRSGGRDCLTAIVDVLVAAGDSVAVATDRLVKTERRRINQEAGMISSVLGHAEVYAVKTVMLAPEGSGTKVTVKIDLFRKTIYTDEAKKDWPEQEAALRSQFFEALSKKLRPAA